LAAKQTGVVVICTGCGLALMTGVVLWKLLHDTALCLSLPLLHHTILILFFLQPDLYDTYILCFCMAVLLGPLEPEDECTVCLQRAGNSHLTAQHHIPADLSLQRRYVNSKPHMSVLQVEEVACSPSSQAPFTTKYLHFNIDVLCFLQQ
jgi:hypothetical protein